MMTLCLPGIQTLTVLTVLTASKKKTGPDHGSSLVPVWPNLFFSRNKLGELDAAVIGTSPPDRNFSRRAPYPV